MKVRVAAIGVIIAMIATLFAACGSSDASKMTTTAGIRYNKFRKFEKS